MDGARRRLPEPVRRRPAVAVLAATVRGRAALSLAPAALSLAHAGPTVHDTLARAQPGPVARTGTDRPFEYTRAQSPLTGSVGHVSGF